jgi:hypothetical protein
MDNEIKTSTETARSYTERQKAKRLKDKRKRIFASIAEYEAQEPEQPPAERED